MTRTSLDNEETGVSLLAKVCGYLSEGRLDAAALLLRSKYPVVSPLGGERKYSDRDRFKVFERDGFIDRYSGQKLIFPGTLRLISKLLPTEFPYHPNWKMDECHIAFWELFPTVDHVVPIALGGADDVSNLVSTSMLRNSVKANFTLEELGWTLLPPEKSSGWYGLTSWFFSQIEQDRSVLSDGYLGKWYRAAAR